MAKRTWKRRLIFLGLWLTLAALAILLAIHLAWGWTPSRATYPTQGVSVGSQTGPVAWKMVRARGADFAYLHASTGARRRDPVFEVNLDGARQAGLRYGPVHDFSLCASALDQATLFIATVPRDPAMLPPVVRLAFSSDCHRRPSRAALLSELDTFLHLIEAHMGKPALIRVSRAFESEYAIGAGVNRTLWLEGNVIAPNYAGRPWVMWMASDFHHMEGIEGAVEWNVVRP